ncbi:lipopolysaccharide biosynthesis protein [Agromyces subbeticus]|uniref:lipopolysaccharide biosynthesis protein n=1 Tax=Agromyces subbeticus TaxID=293890 RepID=UPI0003B3DB70|nr:lipopolysaccharide biosynthesis protein [Agromyces subbeticus]
MAEPLASLAAKGAVVTLAGQITRLIVQLAGIAILARLLLPEDFGLVVMVAAVIGFGELVRDFGLSNAAIQTPHLSRQQRDSLFWINLGIGALLAVATAAAAPLIAGLYGDERLVAVTRALAVIFVLNGLATQHRAGLARSLKFTALAVIDAVTPLLGLGVAITTAYLGWAYWALVAQQVTIAAVGAVSVIAIGRWWPGLPRRTTGLMPLLKYGMNLLGAQMIAYLGRNADSVVIGVRLGAQPLGYYDRAFQLVMAPLNQIQAPASKVAVPVLSRLQGEQERFRSFLLLGQSILVHTLMPAFLIAAALAAPLVSLVLGPAWAASIPVVQILAVAAAVRIAGYATFWVGLSKGFTRVSLYVALISTPLLIVAVLVGSAAGIVGVAIGFAVVNVVMWPVGIYIYGRLAAAPAAALFKNGSVALAGYGAPALAAFGLVTAVESSFADWVLLAGGLGVYGVFLTIAMVCWPQLRGDARRVIRSGRHLRRYVERS